MSKFKNVGLLFLVVVAWFLTPVETMAAPAPTTVASVAALRAGNFSSYANLVVQAYSAGGQIGGGTFNRIGTSCTDDGGLIIKDAVNNCWYRVWSGDYIDLGWYGIAPTTDISGTLIAAIGSVSSRGTITIPTGASTYYINSQVAVGAKKISIDISGNKLQVHASFTGSMFYSGTANGSLILRNGILDGNSGSFTITGYGVNVTADANASEIYGVTIQNFPSDGAVLNGTGTTIVENSTANSNGASGWVGQPVGIMKFTNSGGIGNAVYGGAFAGSLGTIVVGGTWANNLVGGFGFYWGKNGASFSNGGSLTGAVVYGNETGIAVGQGVKYVSVTGNSVYNNTVVGINVDGILNDGVTAVDCSCTLSGNIVSGGQVSVRWNGSINGAIVGNTFINPSNAGLGAVLIRNNSSNALVNSNSFIGTNANIQIDSTATASVGPGNTFLGLASTLAPTAGAGVLKQTATYWSDNVNTTFGNVFPAELYDIDTTGASFTKTLPPAATVGNGQRIRFYKKVAANSLTIRLTGGEHFYPDSVTGGAPTTTADTYTNAGWTVQYVSINDGTNIGWFRQP